MGRKGPTKRIIEEGIGRDIHLATVYSYYGVKTVYLKSNALIVFAIIVEKLDAILSSEPPSPEPFN